MANTVDINDDPVLWWMENLRQQNLVNAETPEAEAQSLNLIRALRMNKYMRIFPSPPQQAFLLSTERECLYQGEGGAGKTATLALMALQYVDVPDHATLIVRHSIPDLRKPGNILPLLHQWLRGTDAVWNETNLTYTFPSNATITFTYMLEEGDQEQLKSAAYQDILWEELTDFPDNFYRFGFRSLRPNGGPPTPLRMRATTNPGGRHACVPFGDVLTPDGWRDIKSMRVGDPVYTVNADGCMVPTIVAQIHQEHYSGHLVNIEARGLSILCTPNHKIAKVGGTRLDQDANFSLLPYDELPGQATVLRSIEWGGSNSQTITIPMLRGYRKHKQPLTLGMRDYAELMGWYLSEGNVNNRDKVFHIAQFKSRNCVKIALMLNKMGFKYSASVGSFAIYSPEWWSYLSRFGKARQKYVPDVIKRATKPILAAFFDAAMLGDGSRFSDTSGVYYTISPQLADDMSEIAVKLGYVVKVTLNNDPALLNPMYSIHFKQTKSGGTEILTGNHRYAVGTEMKRHSDVTMVDYDGDVYCLGIEGTHNFIIRQNGSVWVSGNSWVLDWFLPENGVKKQIKNSHSYMLYSQPNYKTNQWDRVAIYGAREDNPLFQGEAGKEYESAMGLMDEDAQARFLKPDWLFRSSGMLFDMSVVQDHGFYRAMPPARQLAICRFWDKAYTEGSQDPTKGGAMTAGVLMCRVDPQIYGKAFWILDVVSFRHEPRRRNMIIKQTAQRDGIETPIAFESESAAGPESAQILINYLAGWQVTPVTVNSNKSKALRAEAFSDQWNAHNVGLVHAPWNSSFLDNMKHAPNGKVKDQWDAASGCFMRVAIYGGEVADPVLVGVPNQPDGAPPDWANLMLGGMDPLRALATRSGGGFSNGFF